MLNIISFTDSIYKRLMMKKIYTLGLLLFASSIFAQETISFEESEGYTLGNIQNQNG